MRWNSDTYKGTYTGGSSFRNRSGSCGSIFIVWNQREKGNTTGTLATITTEDKPSQREVPGKVRGKGLRRFF